MAASSSSSDPYAGVGVLEADPYATIGAAEPEADPYAGIGAVETQSLPKNAVNAGARGATSEGLYLGIEGGARMVQSLEADARKTPQTTASAARLRQLEAEKGSIERKINGRGERERELPNTDQLLARLQQIEQELPAAQTAAQRETAGRRENTAGGWYAGAVSDTRERIRQALPVDQAFADSLGGQLVSALGQAAGTLPLYLVPGAGPTTTLGQTYQAAYDDAKAHGADDAKADTAGWANLPASALEVAADKLQIGRLAKAVKGKATVGNVLSALGRGVVTEGPTEGLQQAWQNAVASRLVGFDPERRIDDEVWTSMLVGAMAGGLISGGAHVFSGRGAGDASPAEPSATPAVPTQLEGEAAAAFDPNRTANAPQPSAAELAGDPAGAPPAVATQAQADDWADITPESFAAPSPESQTAAPGEAAVPAERTADSVPGASQPTEALASAVTERSGDAQPANAQRKGKSFRIGARPDGVTDVLDALQEIGGIAPPPTGAGGEYDGFAETFRRGLPRLLVRKSAGAVDQKLQELADMGFRFETPDAFYAAVQKATADRAQATERARGEQEQAKFTSAIYDNQRGRQTAGAKRANTDELVVGQRFAIRGEPFEVTDIDADTGEVTVRDGERFGTQVLPASTPVFLDKGSFRQAPRTKPAGDVPFARRGGDARQSDMFAGGDTGGDTLFNLQGETIDADTATWRIEDELARREAAAAAKKQQGELSFAQRDPAELKGKRVTLEALDSSGRKVQIEMDAADAFTETKQRISVFQKLLQCVTKGAA